ncbi:pyoverdine biosynthesis regulatory gene SyrP-like protein [Legionella beliardensis]|uniref:Pyoverdine biosynthesis regulatory gene SyrP-like protein n=1 Tax=Legionella beliardensis TaxID=91822 RepID=A0A378I279_9GAMM|nr:TauD/TfdA family dioxygenase [Legionella beliardensis]STX28801.1 pyoverdine biosynthesis regulatory gene SyrP-like protein [Legionella beliardensis]
MDIFDIHESFPVVATLRKKLTLASILENLLAYKQEFETLLLTYGAIIFRNLPVTEASQFAYFIEKLSLGKFFSYVGGDSPRSKLMDGIYTSTEAPPKIYIPLHQELSYLQTYPKHIYFFCEIEPATRGETIIGDAREVYKQLDPKLVARFQDKKITYISHYYQKSKLMDLINHFARSHKSWLEVFETTDPEEVMQFCKKSNIELHWLGKNWIELKHTMSPLLQHPITKETVWFNQAHLFDFSPKLLGLLRFLAAKLVYFRRLTRLHEVTFADGDKISRKDIYHIMDILDKCTASIPWKRGDIMHFSDAWPGHV